MNPNGDSAVLDRRFRTADVETDGFINQACEFVGSAFDHSKPARGLGQQAGDHSIVWHSTTISAQTR